MDERASGRARGAMAYAAAVTAVVSLATLALPPPAPAASATEIAGKVTSAVTGQPMQGVEACEYKVEGGTGTACAITGTTGEYAIDVGSGGGFVVYFETTAKGYVPRTFYAGVFESSEATRVRAFTGATTSGINEALAEGGRITGTARNAATKAPLENVKACARLPEVPEIAGGLERRETCARTDSSGSYLLEGLAPANGEPPGGYEVEFSSEANFIRQFYKDHHEQWPFNLIPIELGATVSGIDADLEEGAQISGRVTSAASGAPVEGVRVCASYVSCTTTNANGEYTISRLITGEYTVELTAPTGGEIEYIGQFYGGERATEAIKVSVTAPRTTMGIDVALKSYGRIGGKITSKGTKAAIAGVNVCVRYSSACDTTNAHGEYLISTLTAGTYGLEFGARKLNSETGSDYLSQTPENSYLAEEDRKAMNPEANAVQVAMSRTTTLDDQLEEGGRISGQMTSAATGEEVTIEPCAEDLSSIDPQLTLVCDEVPIPHGAYALAELPPGSWRVRFGRGIPAYYFEQYYKDEDQQAEAQPIAIVPGSNITGIDAHLIGNVEPWAGAVAGAVTDATSKALAGIEVCAFEDGSGAPVGECVKTDVHGDYLLPRLLNRAYDIEFRSPAGSALDYARQFYSGAGAKTQATPVSVVSGSITPHIDAQLHPGGRIAGKVTSASGQALAGARICAFTAGGERDQCTSTNTSGEYTTPALQAGQYYVEFSDGGGYATQYFKASATLEGATAVQVSAGATTSGINAQLGFGTGIAGRVTSAVTHAGIAGIEVCAFAFSGELPVEECTLTRSHGEYALTSLKSGAYEVEFAPPVGSGLDYIRQFYDGKARPWEAESVTVPAGVVVQGIDAELKEGGRVAGKVASARTAQPLDEALVCAFTAVSEIQECALSNANGDYTIAGLPEGAYRLGFNDAPAGYAIQYYDAKPFLSLANTVFASPGATVSGIDAQLAPAARIGGRVTDSTGVAIEGVLVCSFAPDGEVVECSVTNAAGDYVIGGLPAAEYRVGFNGGRNYLTQYYDDASTLASAQYLPLAEGAMLAGINASMRRSSPGGLPPPVASAPVAPVVGAGAGALASATATVSSAQIASAMRRGLVPTGSSASIARLLRARRPSVSFTALEAGTATVDWYEVAKGAKVAGHGRAKPVLVAVGRAGFSAAGTKKVALTLTRAGRRMLGTRRSLRLTALGTFRPLAGAPVVAVRQFVLKR